MPKTLASCLIVLKYLTGAVLMYISLHHHDTLVVQTKKQGTPSEVSSTRNSLKSWPCRKVSLASRRITTIATFARLLWRRAHIPPIIGDVHARYLLLHVCGGRRRRLTSALRRPASL